MMGKRGENVAGVSVFPIQCRVSIFWQENPSLLDYDDVVMLCH